MKRVLNSGSIKLPYIQGSEKDILANASAACQTNDLNELMPYIFQTDALKHFKFTFEIKMPVLVAQTFYNAHLGTLTAQEGTNHPIAYLPPQFYEEHNLMLNLMDAKSCNDYNTKLNNFYNWAFNFYNKLIEGGMCSAQAELVLPQGLFRTYLWEVSSKDLISFIEQNHEMSPEMAGYCGTLVLYMEDHLPNVTRWFKANKWQSLV